MKYGRGLLRAADVSPTAWAGKWLGYKQLKKLLKRVVELYRLQEESKTAQGLEVKTVEKGATAMEGGNVTKAERARSKGPDTMRSNPLEL